MAAVQSRKRPEKLGVTVHDPDRAYEGYTLYTPHSSGKFLLIDMGGNVVHTWESRPAHLGELHPNGHLVYGHLFQGVEEIDWSGKSVWYYQCTWHHDFSVLPGGTVTALAGAVEKIFDRPDLFEGCAEGLSFTPNYVLEFEPKTSRRVWQWWAHEHVDELRALGIVFPRPVGIRTKHGIGDLFHINTLEVLPDTKLGQRDPRFRAGNVMLSYRQLDVICVVDRDSGYIVWAWGPGELDGQHQPTLIPDSHPLTGEAMPGAGHILVFDNGKYRRHYSRVLEIDPLTNSIVWSSPTDWYSWHISGAERLPNGNTFVCDGPAGRFFEITADGETVWEYWNPFQTRLGEQTLYDDRGGRDTDHAVYRAVRYPKQYVDRIIEDQIKKAE